MQSRRYRRVIAPPKLDGYDGAPHVARHGVDEQFSLTDVKRVPLEPVDMQRAAVIGNDAQPMHFEQWRDNQWLGRSPNFLVCHFTLPMVRPAVVPGPVVFYAACASAA